MTFTFKSMSELAAHWESEAKAKRNQAASIRSPKSYTRGALIGEAFSLEQCAYVLRNGWVDGKPICSNTDG